MLFIVGTFKVLLPVPVLIVNAFDNEINVEDIGAVAAINHNRRARCSDVDRVRAAEGVKRDVFDSRWILPIRKRG